MKWVEVVVVNVVEWVRGRMVQLLAFAEAVIAVLVGFELVDWTAEQTGLLMSLVAASLGVLVFSENRALRDAVALHELSKAERDEWDRAVLEELGS